MLLHIWVAEAQLIGGGLYLVACGVRRWQIVTNMAVFGALTIIGFTVPMLPVLFSRASIVFRIPAVVYLLVSVLILAAVAKTERSSGSNVENGIGRSGD